ncbi:hypothetical protein FEM48_Zijuj04G0037700 [Ziziphus jujuba var. spinosa]|uniref:AAA+ ATPase domain-containing protein n=1 Tax=Ziziphus jujuba var. spinosa TaxID=714518 RepID=A0A978VHM3_ZIZJJ|nr:hypothetical protein FEM48_Zijuj04G0037700 [Ziziphus jujuba var. spinosa]
MRDHRRSTQEVKQNERHVGSTWLGICELILCLDNGTEAYSAIEHYLSFKSTEQARRLRADVLKDGQSLEFSMDEHEEVRDEYENATLYWSLRKTYTTSILSSNSAPDEKRSYRLTFRKKYRELITGSYLKYVLEKGKAIGVGKKQQKLYTNCPYGPMWTNAVFEHPASLDTLAMDPNKKKEIMEDLETFKNARDYYAKIGRAWKRGYLLYGPPGTGKSTLIAAIANFLNYDIYDVELTAVRDNTDLRKLLMQITSKSIIAIEDIDCSLDLTGQRQNKKKVKDDGMNGDKGEHKSSSSSSKVTLSGLLNFIDGIWSASGGEKLIIFTTNYVEKLDQALIRRGRMDKHIELSYCDFEGFKVLAKNYMNIDSHHLFDTIGCLLEKVNMTPADVTDHLMPKTIGDDVGIRLGSLIQDLRIKKQKVKTKAIEEATSQAEKDPKERNHQLREVQGRKDKIK